MARQGNTTAVGLGWPHQRDRKRDFALLPDGYPCFRCGQPMLKQTQRLHYDHVVPRALGGGRGVRVFSHESCNVRAGGILGARLRAARRRRR
jgi:5-methylcytosine-specific restriction endonuclease McrA